jgi:hypothetical protein
MRRRWPLGILILLCGGGQSLANGRPDGAADAARGGDLDPAVVAKVMSAHLGTLKACYEQSLRRAPSLSGRMVAHWTIDLSGATTALKWTEDTIGDPPMAPCLQAKLASMRFTPPSGGPVEVSFPFVFQPSPKNAKKPPTAAGDDAPESSRLSLGADTELVATVTGVAQKTAGRSPHLEIVRRKPGQAASAVAFDFTPAKYPALAQVIESSFFWAVESSLVALGPSRIVRIGLLGRTGEDLMVLQEIALLVDADGPSLKVVWVGLGDRESNQFDACIVQTHATFTLARPGLLQRTWRSTKSISRGTKDDPYDDYRRKCRAPAVRRDEFPFSGD